VVVEIKALACERPTELGLPLARLSVSEIARVAIARDIVEAISTTTVWRWLREDALRPWRYRSWIFPRDPDFERKAGPILDLYRGRWQGEALRPDEHVICADEKTSIQARARIHAGTPPAPGRAGRVEHEYERRGALAYFAAWDVHRAQVFGRCEQRTGIAPFGRLVDQVMRQEPYASARRVFWVVDNGSSHRGARCEARLRERWPSITIVHTPVHASWLNQVELYFSVVQRKVLDPNDFASLAELEARLLVFGDRYSAIATPFEWRFTRLDLHRVLAGLEPTAVAQAA
jgi:DDE superfamily endonuclease